ARGARLRFLARQLRQLVGRVLATECLVLDGETLCLAAQAPQLVLELLDAGALDRGTAFGLGERAAVRLPALLPFLQRVLGRLGCGCALRLRELRCLTLGT